MCVVKDSICHLLSVQMVLGRLSPGPHAVSVVLVSILVGVKY